MAGEEMIRIAVSELERLISTKNVVGEPVAMGDRVMIPISGYGFGFGGGSGKGNAGAVHTDPTPMHGHGQSAPLVLPPLATVWLVHESNPN